MAELSKPALGRHHERQVRLLIRLLEAELPLTAEEIFASVDEYRQRYERDGGRSDALEKQFERDRESLRHTGIEIETVPDPTVPGDRSQWKYRVLDDPAGGASFALTAEEMLLVDQATASWLDPDVRAGARHAYVKLLGESDSGAVAAGSAPRTVVSTHPIFRALQQAVTGRRRIAFDYLKQRSTRSERRDVDALALLVHRGRWLLVAYDHARHAERKFLVTRILSDIDDLGSHERVLNPARDLVAELDDLAQQHPVRLEVRAGSDAAVRFGAGDGATARDEGVPRWVEVEVYDWDHGLLADTLAGMGTQVRVLSPAEMRDDVRTRLAAVLRSHEGNRE